MLQSADDDNRVNFLPARLALDPRFGDAGWVHRRTREHPRGSVCVRRHLALIPLEVILVDHAYAPVEVSQSDVRDLVQ